MRKLLLGLSTIAICYSGISLGQYQLQANPLSFPASTSAPLGSLGTITVHKIKNAAEDAGLDSDTAERIGKEARDLGAPPGLGSSTTDAANGGSTVAAVTTSTEQGPSGMSG